MSTHFSESQVDVRRYWRPLCVSSPETSVAVTRAQSLHIPGDFLRKGLVKPTQ